MARRKKRRAREPRGPALGMHARVEEPTLLDIVDKVFNRGVVLNGDLVLGVANVDLIYAKLSVLLAAIDKLAEDRVFKPVSSRRAKRSNRKRKRGKVT